LGKAVRARTDQDHRFPVTQICVRVKEEVIGDGERWREVAADYYGWRRRGVELGFAEYRGDDAGDLLRGIEKVRGVAAGSTRGGGGRAGGVTGAGGGGGEIAVGLVTTPLRGCRRPVTC
jgi:hypothetical protein